MWESPTWSLPGTNIPNFPTCESLPGNFSSSSITHAVSRKSCERSYFRPRLQRMRRLFPARVRHFAGQASLAISNHCAAERFRIQFKQAVILIVEIMNSLESNVPPYDAIVGPIDDSLAAPTENLLHLVATFQLRLDCHKERPLWTWANGETELR